MATERDTRTTHVVSGGSLGGTNPTWEIDLQGNARFDGQVRCMSLSLVDGGTTGTIMDNNEFLAGLTTGGAVKRLIGVNTSNVVSIDPDVAGVVLSGGGITIAASGGTVSSVTMGAPGLFPTGTYALPAISFSGEPTTGFTRNHAAGSVSLSILTAESHYWDQTTYALRSNSASIQMGASYDVVLARDAANTLALKNAANAQAFRVYGNASNYAQLTHNGTSATVGPWNDGTLAFMGNGASRWAFLASGSSYELQPQADNQYPIGDSTHRVSDAWIQEVHFGQGADVASANTLTLGGDGMVYNITGTTQINLITTTGYAVGNQVTLKFGGNITVAHNQTAGATTGTILMGSNGSYLAANNYVATFVLCSTGANAAAWVFAGGTRG
jgi:hypothetical protein